jgi:Pvc16 N-terminal domain
MIHEVDEAIRRLLAEYGVPGGGGELAFDSPTKEWTAKRNGPTVNVFLYDIREDRLRRRSGLAGEHDDGGMLVGWRTPPRWFQLSYLVTAWTARPQDEHRLLSQVLGCLVRTDSLAPRWLSGTLAELGLAVPFEAAAPVSEGRSASDVWSALGGELKPAIDLRVTAPYAGERTPAGPPVTEGLVARVTTPTAAVEAGRRLRYDGATGGGVGDGFAVPRTMPLPPGRRRRGRSPE